MDGAKEYNAKRNKPVRETQIPYDFTRMWNLRNKTNEQREKKDTHTHTHTHTPKNRLFFFILFIFFFLTFIYF